MASNQLNNLVLDSKKRIVVLSIVVVIAAIGSALGGKTNTPIVGLDGKTVHSIITQLDIGKDARIEHHQRYTFDNEGHYAFSAIGLALPLKAIGPYTPLPESQPNPEVAYSDLKFSVTGHDFDFIPSVRSFGEEKTIFGAVNRKGGLPRGKIETNFFFRMTGKIVEQPFFDELIWPVTGYRSGLPIKKVQAVVALPQGVLPDDITTKAYTRMGERVIDRDPSKYSEKKARYKAELRDIAGQQRTVVNYWNSQPLEAGELFFIQLRWPKGFLKK